MHITWYGFSIRVEGMVSIVGQCGLGEFWRFWDFRVSGLRDLGQGCFIISMYERRLWKASDLGSSALL